MSLSTGTADAGLDPAEAARRLEEHGPNALPEAAPPRVLSRVLAQLRDPMIVLLLVAGAVTTLTGDVADTVIIVAVVLMNTTLGVLQERRAEQAIRALDSLAAPWAVVLRAGARTRVPAREVVPGDTLALVAGDVVAADGVLGSAHSLQVDESAITGESLPRGCVAGDTVEAGTVVTRGRGHATVLRTGAASGLGRIAALVAAAPVPATPLQLRLTRLSTQLVVGIGLLAGLVLVLGLAQGRSFTTMVVVALSLAVAAVPESLPAVVSIALALGARRMARRHAVVRRLPAVETLGSVTVLASDKTGTLTEGRMTVEEVWAPDSDGVRDGPGQELARDLLLCNDAHAEPSGASPSGRTLVGDPLERAFLELGATAGLDLDRVRRDWPRVAEQPFDAVLRLMVTVHRRGDRPRWRVVVKGAPEAVLVRVVDDAVAGRAREVADGWARAGRRVLMVASRDLDHEPSVDARDLEVRGLVALSDPLRETADEVVGRLRLAGIRLVLVTGDHLATGRAVAGRLGLLDVSPETVEGPSLAERLARDDVRRVGLYARIRPEQKVDVIRALQQSGEVVAMTGDGVNDAPALRTADIGVAMGGSGTEVARQAAALVLVDDDLRTVVTAVEEGRRIYANIRTFLRYGLAGGLAEVAVMLAGPFLGLGVPLLPAQILWINMLTHGLPGVAFGTEPADPGTMRRPPCSPQESILGVGLMRQIAVAGALITAVSLVAGGWAATHGLPVQTSVFVTLGLAQLTVAWALRARVRPRRLQDRSVEAAVLLAVLVQLLAVYVPALHRLLGTEPLPAHALLAAAVLALVPGLVVRLTRGRRPPDPAPPGTSVPSPGDARPWGSGAALGEPGVLDQEVP